MPESKNDVRLRRSKSPAAKLKQLGLIVLATGLVIAGLIYAFAPKDPSAENDPLLADFYDKRDQAAQRMWGNQGPLMVGLFESLKQARTYSVIVAVVSALFSSACFYLAMDSSDSSDEGQAKLVPEASSEIGRQAGSTDRTKRDQKG